MTDHCHSPLRAPYTINGRKLLERLTRAKIRSTGPSASDLDISLKVTLLTDRIRQLSLQTARVDDRPFGGVCSAVTCQLGIHMALPGAVAPLAADCTLNHAKPHRTGHARLDLSGVTPEAVFEDLTGKGAMCRLVKPRGHAPFFRRLVPCNRRFEKKIVARIAQVRPGMMSRSDAIPDRGAGKKELRSVVEGQALLVKEFTITARYAVAASTRGMIKYCVGRFELGSYFRKRAAVGRLVVGLVVRRVALTTCVAA